MSSDTAAPAHQILTLIGRFHPPPPNLIKYINKHIAMEPISALIL